MQNPMPPLLQKIIKPMSENALIKDYIVANLRRLSGISLTEFKSRFQVDFLEKFQDTLDSLKKQKLIQVTKKKVKVSVKGLYLLDNVLEEFL